MIVQLDPELWSAFKRACDVKDQTASQVVRAMVRDFVNSDTQAPLPLAAPKGRKKGGKS